MRLARVPRRDGEMRHRADRGQSLAAEPERADVEQIVVGQFGGGMALDRERQIVARHAAAVVAHADQPASPAVGDDLDTRGAGIERVLHELLDHARRTLHHLARRDAVDDAFGELADGHLAFLGRIARFRWLELTPPQHTCARRLEPSRGGIAAYGYAITTLLTTYRIYTRRFADSKNQGAMRGLFDIVVWPEMRSSSSS